MPFNYPIKFEPILQERIWGGTKLHTMFGKASKNFPVGESWEISTMPNQVSIVANGNLKGQSLQEIIDRYKADFLGDEVYKKYGTNFPLLIKFIDAKTDLSIQLHPDDTLAKKRHNSSGKEEIWYIINAEKESRLLFGFNQELSKKTYLQHLKNSTLLEILHQEKVSKGDVFKIPSGRVHAIGGGIMLAEIQQSSDITYRLFDWNRKDAKGVERELHTDLAMEAIDFNIPNEFKTYYKSVYNTFVPLVNSLSFTTKILDLKTVKKIGTTSKDSFTIYMCVAGKGYFNMEHIQVPISIGECILIPASLKKYSIKPEDNLRLLHIKAS